MQKLFSMFPAGPPGLALILFRLALAVSLLLEPGCGSKLPVPAPVPLRGIAALSLALGVLTPVGAALAVLVVAIGGTAGSWIHNGLLIADAIGLGLIGPGAYAIDARLFGRRRVVYPRDTGDATPRR